MAELVAVSVERHAGLTWQRPANYFFAAKDAIVTLVYHEVPRAMTSMAIAFVDNAGVILPVALQGFVQGRNRFVSDEGRWLGEYIPLGYRAYPFMLARNQDGNNVLAVYEDAAQVSSEPRGEPFFQADGAPAAAVSEVMKLLGDIEKDRDRTQSMCEALSKYDLLEPWKIKAQEGPKVVEPTGIFRISEARLYALEAQELAEVRNTGALMLVFAQLFSMQQIHKLANVGSSTPPQAQPAKSKLSDTHGIISFANL